MPILSSKLLMEINLSHVRQLAQMEVPPPTDTPKDIPPPLLPETAIDWINANKSAILAAQDSQCSSTSPDRPNWDAVLFALVESSAMYLRKPKEMTQAIIAAREGDFERAVAHVEAAQEDIDSIATALDCTFIQLCDFSKIGPEGTIMQSGAFCGLFVSKRTEKPFMGVGFKGSSSFRDFVTDAKWRPINPLLPEIAWGSPVHQGFYEGLFGYFKPSQVQLAQDYQVPFDVLVAQLSKVYSHNARLHFTGHSLGGAYCTLTYGEFLRRQSNESFTGYNFGDMYALGAPRVCLPPFANEVNLRTQPGTGRYLFRIVNHGDPVPTVPPVFGTQLEQYPFLHVGGAWELTVDGPSKMQDEPPRVLPQPTGHTVQSTKNHMLGDYYENWKKTSHS
ncbi:alpha/beta-hydrolase [Cubamyces sp. BRFM 1775]|nr:alpha/beta-hydrolase [Cubamyces sp. BRFM 1775]